jgi:hypothetical protein
MNDNVKRILTGLFIIAAILLAAYLAYRLYNYAVADATQKIRKGVAQGVGEGIGGAINPLNLPKRLIGG